VRGESTLRHFLFLPPVSGPSRGGGNEKRVFSPLPFFFLFSFGRASSFQLPGRRGRPLSFLLQRFSSTDSLLMTSAKDVTLFFFFFFFLRDTEENRFPFFFFSS